MSETQNSWTTNIIELMDWLDVINIHFNEGKLDIYEWVSWFEKLIKNVKDRNSLINLAERLSFINTDYKLANKLLLKIIEKMSKLADEEVEVFTNKTSEEVKNILT